MKTFDADFVKVDQGTLFELILVRDLGPKLPRPTHLRLTSAPPRSMGSRSMCIRLHFSRCWPCAVFKACRSSTAGAGVLNPLERC